MNSLPQTRYQFFDGPIRDGKFVGSVRANSLPAAEAKLTQKMFGRLPKPASKLAVSIGNLPASCQVHNPVEETEETEDE